MGANVVINNFFLDSNSIIYDVFHRMEKETQTQNQKHTSKRDTEDSIIQLVILKIESYIKQVKPSNIVFIAFDGVAPMGKMVQQRTRRNKSAISSKIQQKIMGTVTGTGVGDVGDANDEKFNTVCITPGTEFMKNVGETLRRYFKPRANVIVSCSAECGEGEHKIFQYIRDNGSIQNGNNVIYGLDADLIMLSINHLHLSSNIFLVRETPHFSNLIVVNATKTASTSYRQRELEKEREREKDDLFIMDIKKMSEGLSDTSSSSEYVFICFLLGNDFLPHFPALNIRTGGIDKIMENVAGVVEKNRPKPFQIIDTDNTKGGTICWKNFHQLISILAEKEEEWMKQEFHLRKKFEKRVFDISTPQKVWEKFELIPTFEREVEKYINPNEYNDIHP